MKSPLLRRICPSVSALVLLFAATAGAQDLDLRWLYLQQNLQVKQNLDRLEPVLRRAKEAGYNGVVLADYKLNILDRVPPHYFENARRFKVLCDDLGLEIIPCVAPFGYSSGILAHDPNLAEGLPVINQPLIARGGGIGPEQPGANLLVGDFEAFNTHVFNHWDSQDEPGGATFADEAIFHGGRASLRIEAPAGSRANRRVIKKLAVRPWTPYHASCWIRTENFESAADVRMFAIGADRRTLSYTSLGVKPTQDWMQHHIVFNSLGNQELRFYVGVWNGGAGRLWLDDIALGEEAFTNLVRRDGCPLRIAAEKNGTVFEEGIDFEPVRDEKLGTTPWLGEFDTWHAPVAVRLTPTTRIGEGQRLLGSYYHTVTIYNGQVSASLTEPKVFQVVEDQVRRVNDLLQPQTFFLSHDEIRLAGWSEADHASGKSPGQLLADNVRRCAGIVRTVRPDARLCIWSDMFDPSHNARNNYYLVNGDLAGSWEGLPRDMIVVNWNRRAAAQSVPFFAGRGHDQILAGYYDGPAEQIRNWLAQARSASEATRGTGVPPAIPTRSVSEGVALARAGNHGEQRPPAIRGAMYTTWRGNFADLERFAAAAWGQPR